MEAINLDLLPGAMPPTVHVSQGDVGRQFKIAIYDDTGAAYSLTGKTLSIVGYKGDGNVFQYAIPSSAISGNEVTITTEEQMTPAAGKALCEIRIKQNGTKLGTANFVMDVEQGPADMGSLSISALCQIEALFERAQEDIDVATGAAATATQKASEASASATAAAGSATNAASSASNAADSASNAAISETNASTSETNAATSETNAANSATFAATSATKAVSYANDALSSASAAALSVYKIADMTVSSQSVPYTQPADVVKTEIGGVYNLDFEIPRGEPTSGHDVEANPSGTAVEDLTKLGIDGTIYNVADSNLSTVAHTGEYDDLLNKPNLANVATSGSYDDLDNKPTIPTVNDTLITITQGDVTKGSFTLNQVSTQTIDLDVGGSGVEANPSGTAVEDLTKLGIDGTVYNINGLPDYSQATDGDVLTKTTQGPAWSAPSGGGKINPQYRTMQLDYSIASDPSIKYCNFSSIQFTLGSTYNTFISEEEIINGLKDPIFASETKNTSVSIACAFKPNANLKYDTFIENKTIVHPWVFTTYPPTLKLFTDADGEWMIPKMIDVSIRVSTNAGNAYFVINASDDVNGIYGIHAESWQDLFAQFGGTMFLDA